MWEIGTLYFANEYEMLEILQYSWNNFVVSQKSLTYSYDPVITSR